MMGEITRFLVDVDAAWNVCITCPALGAGWQLPVRGLRRLEDGKGGYFPLPDPADPSDAAEPDAALISGADGGALLTAYQKIAERRPDLGGIKQFGRYLFDTLIGAAAWTRVIADTPADTRTIELALCWSFDDRNLHRLNWEMMCGPDGRFLVAGLGNRGVAITRLVTGTENLAARQLDIPPRVLFVVGTSLVDPSIRPGAEYLGILQQVENEGRRIHHRLLEQATSSRLRAAVSSFRPDVVHFICHGGPGYLELQTDEKDGDPRRSGEQLRADLLVDGTCPAIVVLSACYSAGTGVTGAERARMLRADETAPLAADLVRAGVPIVLGMAGRVSDLACRLFTRGFGGALVRGDALVKATAEARRATFAEGRDPQQSVDWAFPAVFLARGVTEEYVPVKVTQDDPAKKLADRIKGYGVVRPPVFCGRHDFFRACDDLLTSHDHAVLAAYVDSTSPGYGRTRLLQELTIHALREGHVPVLVTNAPKTLVEFGDAVADAMEHARQKFELGSAVTSQWSLVKDPLAQALKARRLDDYIREQLRRYRRITPAILRRALAKDLTALAADAHRQHEAIRQGRGRVLLLLDEVDNYGEVVPSLFETMLDGFGLGTPDQPVPVVLTFSLGGVTDHVLRPVVEKGFEKPWLILRPLKPFEENGEDLLAYELVLLHPFMGPVYPGVSDQRWAFNDDVDDEIRKKWAGYFRMGLRGMPVSFENGFLYVLAKIARDDNDKYVIDANDDIPLQKIGHRG